MTTKMQYRDFFKNIRNSLSEDDACQKSELIYNKLLLLEEFVNANTIFVYLSYGREVNTDRVLHYLFSKGKSILVPKCNVNTETMIPVKINSFSELITGGYGIREPIINEEYFGKIDLAIIPGVAFDRFGNRIGHGKGYYDKFLENTNVCKIGFCYSNCLSDVRIPCYNTDIAMDYIITDREVLNFKI